jgi:hypothetical protein
LFRHKTRKHGFLERMLSGALAVPLFAATFWYLVPQLKRLDREERARMEGVMASVTYSGCDEVRALGKAPLRYSEPGYRSDIDGGGDGVACEPHY